jgi:hypothetical protein
LRIIVSCPECIGEKENSAILALGNENTYKVVCDKGHIQNISLPHQRHEILFEFGVYAIADGYYREAISSFAAALERYYEYFLRVISTRSHSTKYFDQIWKQVSSQSERQLGGYIFAHFLVYNQPPTLIDNPLIELRNKAIHKGYIPEKEEALKFGAGVANLVNSGVARLHEHFRDEVHEITRQTLYPDSTSGGNRVHIHQTYLNSLTVQNRMELGEYAERIETHNRARY